MTHINWNGFNPGPWQDEINVRDFIQRNYTEFKGEGNFLASPTKRTLDLMKEVNRLLALEREKGGVLDIDTETVSSLTSYATGYIDKEKEIIGNCFFVEEDLTELTICISQEKVDNYLT